MSTPAVYLRPSPRDLRDIPLDTDTAMRARLSLPPRELGVWFNLRTHLWMFGELPVALKRLAAIGGIGARSFEKMMPVLAPLFDRDEAGRWRDLDLEDERNTRLDLTPDMRASQAFGDTRRVDPALSEARRKAGQDGARKRWENRTRLQVVGGTQDAEPLPSVSFDNMANAGAEVMANRIANETVLPSGFAAALPSVATADASEAHSKLASLDSSNLNKIQELAGKQAARAPEGADGKPMAKTDVSAPEPIANESDVLPLDLPSEALDKPVDPPAETKWIEDATLIDAIVRVCKGKVTKPEALGRLPVFRAAMAEGMDFFQDVLPKLEGFARRNKHVENCANRHIIDDARKHAQLRTAAAKLPTHDGATATDGKVFVAVDTPEWRAWLKHTGKKSFPSSVERDRRKGWLFDSQWPPGMDSARNQTQYDRWGTA